MNILVLFLDGLCLFNWNAINSLQMPINFWHYNIFR